MEKQRAVSISDDAWELAKKAAEESKPKTNRPAWIENAIYKQAKREGVK
jgi:hypothetical protein